MKKGDFHRGIGEAALKMMKYEKVHANRISPDLLTDLTVAQAHYVYFCGESVFSKLPGYIQEIVWSPFGFLLMSEIQVGFFHFSLR